MACLIKAPSEGSKGVVVFTTQERDRVIRPDRQFAERVAALKDRWLIGLHHNWHDYAFTYDPLYDFSMAGEEDLREVNGREFPLIPLDACNFVPSYFSPARSDRFWTSSTSRERSNSNGCRSSCNASGRCTTVGSATGCS